MVIKIVVLESDHRASESFVQLTPLVTEMLGVSLPIETTASFSHHDVISTFALYPTPSEVSPSDYAAYLSNTAMRLLNLIRGQYYFLTYNPSQSSFRFNPVPNTD